MTQPERATRFNLGDTVTITLNESATYCQSCGVAAPAKFAKYCGDGRDKDYSHDWKQRDPPYVVSGVVESPNGPEEYFVKVEHEYGATTWKCRAEWLSLITPAAAPRPEAPMTDSELEVIDRHIAIGQRSPYHAVLSLDEAKSLRREVDRLRAENAALRKQILSMAGAASPVMPEGYVP